MGSLASTSFKYLIQINKNLPAQYQNCFTESDYAQQVIGTIDTALLAKSDNIAQLTLDELLTMSDLPAFAPTQSTKNK